MTALGVKAQWLLRVGLRHLPNPAHRILTSRLSGVFQRSESSRLAQSQVRQLAADKYGFLLGLAIGLSFMQAGYAWGQYREYWWRFFMENRTAIFDAPANNKPTKRIALTYVLAVLARYSYITVALLVAVIAMYAMDAYPATWRTIRFPWDLLIACAIGAVSSAVLTNRLMEWGEAKSKQLTDFSYVFETEPEQQSD